MLKGMVIPGDMVEEEYEGSASSDGYRTPSPEEYMFRPLAIPRPSAGKTRKKRKTKEQFYKGYGVVYLPEDIKGLTDKLHFLLAELIAGNTTGLWVGCTVEIETVET